MTTIPLYPPPGSTWRIMLNVEQAPCRICGKVLPYLTRGEGPHDVRHPHAIVVLPQRNTQVAGDSNSEPLATLTLPVGARLWIAEPDNVVLMQREHNVWEVEADQAIKHLNAVSRSLLLRMVEEESGSLKTGRYVVDIRGGQIVSVSIVLQPLTSKHVNGHHVESTKF